ncbi:MAG TPA: hypothetical protein VFF67_04010 [Thermoplasmata archaeon]|nr:hypothetical protein [Thermoplasmata archaeon]
MRPAAPDLESRLRALEQQVAELRARVEALERFTAPRVEHPTDRAAVRDKASFDWQR